MTDTANGTRVSAHDHKGADLDAYIADHISLWGFPPIAGADPEDDPDDPDDDKPSASAEAEKWKALAKKHEKRAKENSAAANKLAEIEESTKSETQQNADRIAAEKARADKAEGKLERIEVALEKAPEGMKPAQILKFAKRLSGSSRDELEEDADELFGDFTPPKDDGDPDDPAGAGGKDDDTSPTRRRPSERLKPGAAPDADPDDSETDPDKLAAKVPRY